ncbi:MAG: dihydroorotate dehydrogenase [Candidatus Bathyarchaeia archaeon]
MQPNVAIDVAGLHLRNPIMLAAGVLGLSGASLRSAWGAGAGAVVTKSLGLKPRTGYSNPTLVDVGCGFLNAMGLPNPGVEEFVDEVKAAKKGDEILLVASVFGETPQNFAEAASVMEDAGVDGIELNVSCPHVKAAGMEIGQDPTILKNVVRAVKNSVQIPVFTKLTPNTSHIKDLARTVEQAGGDGIVAVNTLRAMAIDVETGRPILANKIGGLSGPALKPVALRCVYEIAQTVNIPVIGCGGVTSWRDVIEFLLAGARAVQIGSAIAYKDLAVFHEVVTGVREYLQRKEYGEVEDIIGLSQKY